jgi:hypothetical protein
LKIHASIEAIKISDYAMTNTKNLRAKKLRFHDHMNSKEKPEGPTSGSKEISEAIQSALQKLPKN